MKKAVFRLGKTAFFDISRNDDLSTERLFLKLFMRYFNSPPLAF